jgi:glutamyl-tRNA synthetase
VRVRLAPSPTGYMHVGTARTALFNWLYARHCGGEFVLRVEDTDRSRFVPSALDDLLEGLRWLGLEPDEGPGIGGAYGPYMQSQRLDLYLAGAERLLAAGRAYRCFCSPERLERTRAERAAAGLKVGYDRHCRSESVERAAARAAGGEPHVVRLAMPMDGTLTLRDQIRGDIVFDVAEMEDVVLLKGDGYPTYHLAVVVDDHEMAITHVLRADEWIPSAPVQVWLYSSFGWREPVWAHLPLVLNPGGQGKLSKRKRPTDEAGGETGSGAAPLLTQVREYRAAGYLPEAMANFLALLGWAYSGEDEIFDLAAAAARFDLDAVRPAPSAWDVEKLRWMNGVYIRALAPDDLAERLLPYLREAGLPAEIDQVRRMAPLVQERLETLPDCVEWLAFFWAADVSPGLDDLVPKKLDAAGTASVLAAAEEALRGLPEWTAEAIEGALRDMAARLVLGAAQAFGPLRVAVSGQKVSPPLFETLEIVGRPVTLERLARARERLTAPGG